MSLVVGNIGFVSAFPHWTTCPSQHKMQSSGVFSPESLNFLWSTLLRPFCLQMCPRDSICLPVEPTLNIFFMGNSILLMVLEKRQEKVCQKFSLEVGVGPHPLLERISEL